MGSVRAQQRNNTCKDHHIITQKPTGWVRASNVDKSGISILSINETVGREHHITKRITYYRHSIIQLGKDMYTKCFFLLLFFWKTQVACVHSVLKVVQSLHEPAGFGWPCQPSCGWIIPSTAILLVYPLWVCSIAENVCPSLNNTSFHRDVIIFPARNSGVQFTTVY